MSIRVTSVSVRPNTNVDFWNYSAEDATHLQNTFVSTGKLVSKTSTLSNDGLTRTVVRTFATPEDFAEFKLDSVRTAGASARDAYNTANGITLSNVVDIV